MKEGSSKGNYACKSFVYSGLMLEGKKERKREGKERMDKVK